MYNIISQILGMIIFNYVPKKTLMMKKIMIPAILGIIMIIGGIFAFMPVERASTVHGTLATTTNVEEKIDAQDRSINFFLNFSHIQKPIVVLPAESGKTFSGHAIISAMPNNVTVASAGQDMNCGLETTVPVSIGINATGGNTTAATFSLSSGEGLQVVLSNNSRMTGVCSGTLVVDSWGG